MRVCLAVAAVAAVVSVTEPVEAQDLDAPRPIQGTEQFS